VRYRRLAADLDTTNPTSWNQLGETELAIGSPPSATLAFRRALHWDPWSVRALNGLGNAALAQGDRAAARSAFRRSLVAAPAQAGLRRQLAGLSGP
jgi:Flp pilus assembly protein TadD